MLSRIYITNQTPTPITTPGNPPPTAAPIVAPSNGPTLLTAENVPAITPSPTSPVFVNSLTPPETPEIATSANVTAVAAFPANFKSFPKKLKVPLASPPAFAVPEKD